MHFAFKCSFNTKQSFIKDFSLVEKGTGGRGTVGGGRWEGDGGRWEGYKCVQRVDVQVGVPVKILRTRNVRFSCNTI